MQLVVQTTWGHLVAWYLFLAGAGAGLYVISIGVKLFRLNDSFAKPAYYASPFIVIVASVLLLLDLGQPLRALLAVLRPHASMISVGTVILSLCFLVNCACAVVGFVTISEKSPLASLKPIGWPFTVQPVTMESAFGVARKTSVAPSAIWQAACWQLSWRPAMAMTPLPVSFGSSAVLTSYA